VDAFASGISVADVLARPASCPKFSLRDVSRLERSDVVMKWNLRPMSLENALAKGVDFAMEGWYHSSSLESQIKSTYSGEKRSESDHSSAPECRSLAPAKDCL
jgi:hypothetical protein